MRNDKMAVIGSINKQSSFFLVSVIFYKSSVSTTLDMIVGLHLSLKQLE